MLGISPHRFSGWEPSTRTTFTYDGDGTLVETVATPDPEWDEVDRALIDVYRNWKADLHVCGRPLTESLADTEKTKPDYVVATETCLACQALDKHHAEHAADDRALREAGRDPDSWRLPRVLPFSELDPADQQIILADRAARGRTGPTT